MNYEWDFGAVWRHADLLLEGGIGTVSLTVSSFAIAMPLGLLLALLRMSKLPVVSGLVVAFIEIFRAAPAFVLIIWFYFALPILAKINFSPYTAAVLAVGLQSAAFFAEIFRGGIQSITRGQWEAARAIGMSHFLGLRHIILPQAIKRMVPVLFTRLIEIVKATSLAAVITYQELIFRANEIATQTFRPIETFTVVGLIYFCVIFAMSQLTRRLERRLAVSD